MIVSSVGQRKIANQFQLEKFLERQSAAAGLPEGKLWIACICDAWRLAAKSITNKTRPDDARAIREARSFFLGGRAGLVAEWIGFDGDIRLTYLAHNRCGGHES